MLVEFKSVQAWWKEQYQKDIDRDLKGRASVPFENKEDVIMSITIEMDEVMEFEEGIVFHNDTPHPCVYVTSRDREYTSRNLLIDYDDFKILFEKAKGVKIVNYKELISEEL